MFYHRNCITFFFFFYLVPGWHAESQEHVDTVLLALAFHIGGEYIFGYLFSGNRLFQDESKENMKK
jgi:hypothetical protein